MSALPIQYDYEEKEPITWSEFLAFNDKHPDERYEYIGGFPHMLATCKHHHSIITGNVYWLTRNHLIGSPCEIHQSDMLLQVNQHTAYLPDVMVSCDEQDKENKMYIEHPSFIVEVLSPGTRKKDKTIKYTDYFSLPSVQAYLLVDSEKIDIQLFQRKQDGQIVASQFGQGATFTVDCIGLSFSVDDIYERITF